MRNALFSLIAIALVSCATNDAPPPRDMPRERPARGARMSAELSLPIAWWHDPGLAEPLALSAEQFQKLDALSDEQSDVDRLERDGMTAMRDVQSALEARNASAADIISAGKRLREMRDTLLDRQIALLAAQREILTQDQWATLQRELAEERRERMSDSPMRGRGMGGRGGRGGGRRPGAW